MLSAVLVLSLVVAMDPVRIGIAALLISRPRPILNLLSFWLGGIAAGVAIAVVVLVFLRDFTLSVMRVVDGSPIVARIQIALGVLAVSVAAVIAARLWPRRRAATGGEPSVQVLEPNKAPASRRRSIRAQVEGASLVVAFVAGLGLATPPVEYLAAIIAILASGATAAVQVVAAIMFTLVAFTVVEVPLITYLAAPARTLAVVQRLNDWISVRRQAIPAVVVGALGLILAVTGIGKI